MLLHLKCISTLKRSAPSSQLSGLLRTFCSLICHSISKSFALLLSHRKSLLSSKLSLCLRKFCSLISVQTLQTVPLSCLSSSEKSSLSSLSCLSSSESPNLSSEFSFHFKKVCFLIRVFFPLQKSLLPHLGCLSISENSTFNLVVIFPRPNGLLSHLICLSASESLLSHLSLYASETSAVSSQSFCFRKVCSLISVFLLQKGALITVVFPNQKGLSPLISFVFLLQKGLLSHLSCLSTSERSALSEQMSFHFRKFCFQILFAFPLQKFCFHIWGLSFHFQMVCSLISLVFLLRLSSSGKSTLSSQLSFFRKVLSHLSCLSASERSVLSS